MGRLRGCLKKMEMEKKKQKPVGIPSKKEATASQDKRIPMHRWSDGVKTTIPIRSFINPDSQIPTNTILVIGDGDLSYTLSLIKDHFILEDSIITSVPEKSEEALVKSFRCEDNIAFLKNVKVLYGIDVMKKLNLPQLIGEARIARIVFNHPHTGEGIKDRDLNIKSQKKLILQFLLQASLLLEDAHKAKDRSISLVDPLKRSSCMAMDHSGSSSIGTGGGCCGFGTGDGVLSTIDTKKGSKIEISTVSMEPEIHLTVWEGDPYDLWDVKKLAFNGCPKLALKESFPFIHKRYPSYAHQKTNGHSQDSFAGRKSRTYVFVRKSK